MSDARDRLEALLASTTLNGIDFIEVVDPADQTELRVHFLNGVTVTPLAAVNPVTIRGGERVTEIGVTILGWSADRDGRPVLDLRVDTAGDFSFYTLAIDSPALDRFFNHVAFSFKALCPSTLDCEPAPHECPPPAGSLPPIDYLAKDFTSFRKALSDFSRLRYPEWEERSEADFGMMFMEALCKVGDDLSYLQDRIRAEASLETATQRRSLVRHARMVDYEPRPATAARVVLQFDVPAGTTSLPAGIGVDAATPDGTRIRFETGEGLLGPQSFPVNRAWNRNPGMRAYYWDDALRCLVTGSTEAWIEGWNHELVAGMALLIDTAAVISADPPQREVVHLSADGEQTTDPLFGENGEEITDPLLGRKITRIVWSEPLQFNHDISRDAGRTVIAGNLVPGTQGRRVTEMFAIDQAPSTAPDLPLAVVRHGSRYLWPLGSAPLAFLAPADGGAPLPEIDLVQQSLPPRRWDWRRTILDAAISATDFVLEPFRMSRVANLAGGAPFYDYDGDDAHTIRFGDGVFGAVPDAGTTFTVTYRVGGGAGGNLAADTINAVDSASPVAGLAVTNPFNAGGGADQETAGQIRLRAPRAFRATQYRAVRAEDYSRAAETLPWVSRGGTTFRWTGSWRTIFTTADPVGSTNTTIAQRIELVETLDRYRLAGREVVVPLPVFVALDLSIVVCAGADAFRGDVEEAILAALVPGTAGFFHPDQFTFGTPLYRSRLEAVIQSAQGVGGVVSLRTRRRGIEVAWSEMPEIINLGVNQILRVENDPSLPDHGSINLTVRGGK
jgi:Baseplate J-like protein